MRAESRPGTYREKVSMALPAILLAGALSQGAIKPAEAVMIPDEVEATVCYQNDIRIEKHDDGSRSTTHTVTRSYTTIRGDHALNQISDIKYNTGIYVNSELSYIWSDNFTGTDLYFSSTARRNGVFSSARGVVVREFPPEQSTEIFQDGMGVCRDEKVKSEIFMAPGMYYEPIKPGKDANGTLINIDKQLKGFWE